MINKVTIFDWDTHYTGYYSDNHTVAHFTGRAGKGTPYLMFGGFGNGMIGKSINVQCDNQNIGFSSRAFTVTLLHAGDYSTIYDLDGSNLGETQYGLLVADYVFPAGTYNFTFTYGFQVYKIKVIKEF